MFGEQRGVTLIELMVAIAVFAIMLVVGLPSFASLIDRQREQSVAEQLLLDLTTAKSEAQRQHKPVYVCSSNDGSTCNGEWGDGYIVCVDTDRNNSCDSLVKVIKEPKVRSITITPSAALLFSPNGMVTAASFTICANRHQNSEILTINITGKLTRAAVSNTSCPDN